MDRMNQEATFNGMRQSDLKKSFKLAIRSLLTTCSRQEFSKVFSKFTSAEQQSLHRLFVQVITSLHESIEDEFDALCLETQVGMALHTVEQLLEEQDLDPLSSDKTNLRDVMHNLSTVKKNEIQHLMGMLERVSIVRILRLYKTLSRESAGEGIEVVFGRLIEVVCSFRSIVICFSQRNEMILRLVFFLHVKQQIMVERFVIHLKAQ